jgi:hypothetical protein
MLEKKRVEKVSPPPPTTEHPMHSKIFLQHPNVLIQAHLQGNK